MKYKIILKSILFILIFQSCNSQNKPIDNKSPVWEPEITYNNLNKAYFASGCFWCVEAIYESIRGVKEVYSGYAGGKTKYPTYKQIGTGLTNHSESSKCTIPSVVTIPAIAINAAPFITA